MCKNSKCQGPLLCRILPNMNYLPTCTSRLVVQHPCRLSFKSMQGCWRSWEYKLKCVKILSVKDHNSAKICLTWIISPTCTSRLVVQHLYQVSLKSMQGCKRCWEVKLWWEGRTEGRKDGMTNKANTKCPRAIVWKLTLGKPKSSRLSKTLTSVNITTNNFNLYLNQRKMFLYI